MNIFFVVDEYTDVAPQQVVREIVEMIIDALNHPGRSRPPGELIFGEMARQSAFFLVSPDCSLTSRTHRFWDLATKTASESSQRHFIESFSAYLHSLIQQAADRENESALDVDQYLRIRRQNIGANPSYAPLELAFELPDEVFSHPLIVQLSSFITDIIILDNVCLMSLSNRCPATLLTMHTGSRVIQQGASHRGRLLQHYHHRHAANPRRF